MKRSILFMAVSFVFSIFVFADGANKTKTPPVMSLSINGQISDLDNHETLAGVLVSIEGTSQTTYTDLDGNFSFEGVEQGDYKLNVSYISYKEQKINHTVSTNNNELLKLTIKSE